MGETTLEMWKRKGLIAPGTQGGDFLSGRLNENQAPANPVNVKTKAAYSPNIPTEEVQPVKVLGEFEDLRLVLPWPPSENNLKEPCIKYKDGKPYATKYPTKALVAFRKAARAMIVTQGCHDMRLGGRMEVILLYRFPTRGMAATGDVDNRDKAVLDALEDSNVIDNDKRFRRCILDDTEDPIDGGLVEVIIRPYKKVEY